ncbi:MAG: RNA polymerase sigma factor [Alphaproteobacteria bacterium]|nr:RNA polymerase sigma factor [Alphaproteobacteria bacterium]MBU1514533.1 RNA polymerase sigma factor [Alphaproteobacteria bacterium]MBU2096835.1 RNA polymerase sigma factor [Alphaproteobacteria bacterium]MBU2153462.1 RNA polymerase sigma factor [Alphaproteobacteria bacterium]MBU2306033.1 RNA polymerase sigma factor [Alphaproteobacteria bacterium]
MRRHKAALFRFAQRYTGNADAAYDVVQESFVAAWKALDRYDGRRSFGVWLRSIALNKARDRARRLFVRRLVFGQSDLDSPEARRQADPQVDAEATLLARERRQALDAALAQLPAALKAPLILTYFEGLSQQQAGEVLGLTAKAVEVRVYRARQRLAQLLALEDSPESDEG